MAGSKTIAVKPLDIPKFKPSLSLDSDDLPQLKNLKIGDKCTLIVHAEVVHLSNGNDYEDNNGAKTLSGRFKVDGVEYKGNSDNASRSDKLNAVKNKAQQY